MKEFGKFFKVLSTLEKEQVEYILIGGFAVIIYGLPRLTQDIDIFVKMSEANLQKLRNALSSLFEDESIQEITMGELKEYSVIRYGSPDGFYIDILARLGDFATYETLDYQEISLEGVNIKIATPETLFNLKKDTLRPEDKRDAFYLYNLIREKDKNKDVKDERAKI